MLDEPKLDRKVFAIGKAMIEANWGREIPESMINVWYENLKVYTNSEFELAVNALLREERGDFMPPFGRLIDRCKAERRKRTQTALESSEARLDAEWDLMSVEERDRLMRENRAKIRRIINDLNRNYNAS